MSLVRPALITALAAAGLLLGGTVAGAQPPSATVGATCDGSGGPAALPSGTYHGLVVKGYCVIPDGAAVTILGNVTVTAGSNLNAETMATVTITGNVTVGWGANFGLGCTLAAGCDGQTSDVLHGSIVADHPLALQLNGDTIAGSVTVTGGQDLTCAGQPIRGGYAPSNFPVKDNVIRGNVMITGWTGCWLGFIRNQVHGSVIITGTTGVQTGESGALDSTEVDTNQIWGMLSCSGNSPAAQIGDSGGIPNVVSGSAVGECAAPLSTVVHS